MTGSGEGSLVLAFLFPFFEFFDGAIDVVVDCKWGLEKSNGLTQQIYVPFETSIIFDEKEQENCQSLHQVYSLCRVPSTESEGSQIWNSLVACPSTCLGRYIR